MRSVQIPPGKAFGTDLTDGDAPCVGRSGPSSRSRAAAAAAFATALSLAATPAGAEDFPKWLKLDALSPATGLTIRGVPHSNLGYALAAAGDVNGDGLKDIVAGSPYVDGFGAAYVIFGAQRGRAGLQVSELDGTNGFVVTGLERYGFFGAGAAGAGDVNGDGLDDVVFGAPRSGKSERRDAGEAFVIFGGTGGFPASLKAKEIDGSNGFRILGSVPEGGIGGAVAGAGDVNGDGFGDFLIGGSSGDGLSENAYLIFGRAEFPAVLDLGEIDGTNGVRFYSSQSELMGTAVAGAGDIDGDGFDDVLIGDPDPTGRYPKGAAYLVYGHSGAFPKQIAVRKLDGTLGFAISGSIGSVFGSALGGGQDVNGDGLSDMILGDSDATVQSVGGAGAAFVVYGRSERFPSPLTVNRLKQSQGIRIDGVNVFGSLGQSVALAPDINGDGLAEAIAGSPKATAATHTGTSYIVLGDRKKFPWPLAVRDLDGSNGFTALGVLMNDQQGFSVAGLGDFDGDGLGDFATGSPYATRGDLYEIGEIYVVYGRPESAADTAGIPPR